MVMPLRMAVRHADGTVETVALPVEMWNLGSRFIWRGDPGRPVTAVTVDPWSTLPDVARDNNHWPR
jgi:hypothetical protein